jgi:chromosomal replication initiator protein
MMNQHHFWNRGIYMKTLQDNWTDTLELLRPELTQISFDTWFAPLLPKKLDEGQNILYIECNEAFTAEVLHNRYVPLLETAVKTSFKTPLRVELVVKSPDPETDGRPSTQEKGIFESEFYFNPRYRFENFVVGSNNQYAHAVALAVAETPSKLYNPLFIYGGSGLGKTHLMHAIGHYILEHHKKLKILYVSSEMFTNELITALKEKKNINTFKKKYRNVDVLLIDDIQFIENKEATQEEFFHTFNSLYDLNKQIIISSDRHPTKLTNLDERLRSRFAWNIVADIQPPDYETRVAILMKKAELERVEITDNVLQVINLIAEKIRYNVRELEGAFSRIISFSIVLDKPITVSFAKEKLTEIFTSGDLNITVETIKRSVCKYYNITIKDMESAKKTRDLAVPRQVAMYLCREMTNHSLPKIGEAFGGRDHTTVLHAHEKITKSVISDENIKKAVDELTVLLGEK